MGPSAVAQSQIRLSLKQFAESRAGDPSHVSRAPMSLPHLARFDDRCTTPFAVVLEIVEIVIHASFCGESLRSIGADGLVCNPICKGEEVQVLHSLEPEERINCSK